MAKKDDYEKQTEELLEPLIKEFEYELVDVEYVKEGSDYFLRAYIDKEGGITINDCEKVSRRLSTLLDERDFIDTAYILEVSSPGLGRQLKKNKDYERSIGKEVEIKLYKGIDKQKELRGVLKSFDNTGFIIAVDDKEILIEKSNVARIALAFDFN